MRAETLYDIRDVTASSMESGDVRVNVGSAITNEGEGSDGPWWANGDGFVSRPNGPGADGACKALFLRHGNKKICIASRDGRYSSKAGELQPGDRAIVSRGEARFLLKAENDSVTLYTANQQDDDSSMMITAVGETGTILIANGGAYIEMKKDKIVMSAGKAMLVLDGLTGAASFFASHFAANAKSGNLGVVGAIPPPTGVNSILVGATGMAGIPSAFWTIATT